MTRAPQASATVARVALYDERQPAYRQAHVAVDTDDRWYMTIGPERISTSRQGGSADLVLTGTAEDLYLVLWNRLEDSRITVSGDDDLLEVWHNNVRVRWS